MSEQKRERLQLKARKQKPQLSSELGESNDFESPFLWRTNKELLTYLEYTDSVFVNSSRAEAGTRGLTQTAKAMANDTKGRSFSHSSDSSAEDVNVVGFNENPVMCRGSRDESGLGLVKPNHHTMEERLTSLMVDDVQSLSTLPPSDMSSITWYHFNISRHVAESLLISTGEDGSYLMRDSASNPGEFTLSVRAKHTVKHFPIRWNGTELTFGFGRFSSVQELLEHFASKPVIGGQSGVLTVLKFPYPRCVDEPEMYDMIRVHAEWGPSGQQNDQQKSPTFAIASKEGYMTKLGQHRKNWKTRWFVLLKNELSYYKTREERNPIRTIDLKDVLDVTGDDSLGQQNCIKVVTSYRTFFMYSSSAQEAEEWIKILQWKLVHPSGTENTLKPNC